MLQGLQLDRSRITELETQILELEQTISALREEKASVQERLDSYKYPVLTLPNEVVSEIFIHFVPTFPCCSTFGGICSPIHLTQICRMWREIAVSTPHLWRAMLCWGNNALIDVWLRRSGCCPLSLQFGKSVTTSDCSQAFSAFLTHRVRWEHVNFDLVPSYLSAMDDGPTPLLRHLRLSLDELPNSLNFPISAIATFSDAPMLRTVALNYFAAANIILPWAQLTSLTLEEIFPREWVPILRQTSNLVECRLNVAFDADAERPWADVQVPSLESLTLTIQDSELDGFIGSFVVPALRVLDVSESLLRPNPIETLTSFISTSSCTLQHLCIAGERSVPMDSYRRAFTSIPHFSFQHDDKEESEN
ncbi:hypothetical protein DFH06DRAFT_1195388 [Mycena polygramma]|nr:hypothetical protein DFH06DRAFT_1195388 [Mycena polygramma]